LFLSHTTPPRHHEKGFAFVSSDDLDQAERDVVSLCEFFWCNEGSFGIDIFLTPRHYEKGFAFSSSDDLDQAQRDVVPLCRCVRLFYVVAAA